MGRLTVAGVRNAKPGRHADGDGLYLLVKASGSRTWLLRVQVDGRRRDIGLGSAQLAPRDSDSLIAIPLLHQKRLSLAEAREKCSILRKAAEAGMDPVLERDRDRRGIPTFEQAATEAQATLKGQWAPRQQAAFLSSLKRHAFPSLGRRRVDHIVVADIQATLEPIWSEKPDMARKVKHRIATVLNYAHSKGWRAAEAPGKSISVGLAKRKAGGNYKAMPYAEVPAFIASLNAASATVGRAALLFTILTAARSGEVRNARWCHIDLEQRLWNRPAELMKMRRPHAVTLNDGAIAILERVLPLKGADDDLIFPSNKSTPLSDMTLSKIMRDAKLDATVHGFRSSFRDWAAECMPNIPDAVAETALAHGDPDKVQAAYRRTDFIKMRRTLHDAWNAYLLPSSIGSSDDKDQAKTE